MYGECTNMKSLKILILLIIVCNIPMYGGAFSTLQSLEAYAYSAPEHPQKDNGDWLNPDYSKFHRSRKSSIFTRMISDFFEALHLKKQSWSPYFFFSLLNRFNQEHKASGTDDHIIAFCPPSDAQFSIWTDLQGAFHSLVRDLKDHKEHGILNDNLEIIKPNYYFIFNGNVIDRSAYNLETLTVILQLLEKNPDKVFYIRGSHEDNELWKHYGLRRELEVRAHYISRKDKAPLEAAINTFFQSLPLAVYLKMEDIKKRPKFIRISHFGRNDDRLSESYFAPILENLTQRTPRSILINRSQRYDQKLIDVRVIIKGERRATTFDVTDGLKMISPDQGATAWSLLSAPTDTYQNVYNFFNDAFVVLKAGRSPRDWIIELDYQDTRLLKGFKKKQYTLILGQEVTSETLPIIQHLSYRPITVGCSLDLKRSSSSIGRQLLYGLSLRVNEENKKLNENAIRLVFLDDNYVPSKAHHNVETFLKKDKTNIILSPLGTTTVEALLDKLTENKILVLFPYTGSDLFRKKELTSVINYRTSYAQEAEVLIEYAVAVGKLKKFALFYQDDSYGRSALRGAQAALRKNGIKEWLETSYIRNSTQVENASKKITEYSPEVIIFFSTYAPAAELIRSLNLQTLASQSLMAISFVGDAFKKFMDDQGLHLTISHVVPNPVSSKLPIVEEYRRDVYENNSFMPFTVESLEGYINASIFIDACNHISGDITKEKLMHYFEGLKNYNFKGLNLNFDPETRELSNEVWIESRKRWISSDELDKIAQKDRTLPKG